MGSPVSPATKEVTEASTALVVIAESLASKLEGGLTLDEASQVFAEAGDEALKGVEGLSLDVIGQAFTEDLEGTASLVASGLARATGVLVGKPVQAVEKSDLVEIVEAVGGVAVSVLNAAPGRAVLPAILAGLVLNRAKIQRAVEGRSDILAQFSANPFGQGLATVESVLGFSRALRGIGAALKAAT